MFFHLFNDQIQALYGLSRKLGKRLKQACSASLRLALIESASLSIPTVDLVQSPTAIGLRDDLRVFADYDLVRFVGSTANVDELLVRKKSHYEHTSVHGEWFSKTAKQRVAAFEPYLEPRRLNTTASMKLKWSDAALRADDVLRSPRNHPREDYLALNIALIARDSGRPGRVLSQMERLPSNLETHAFLRSVIDDLGILAEIASSGVFATSIDMGLAYAWMRGHLDEYGSKYICRAPYGIGAVACFCGRFGFSEYGGT
jgi:hypothetical protein